MLLLAELFARLRLEMEDIAYSLEWQWFAGLFVRLRLEMEEIAYVHWLAMEKCLLKVKI